jgi:hypothetical protein
MDHLVYSRHLCRLRVQYGSGVMIRRTWSVLCVGTLWMFKSTFYMVKCSSLQERAASGVFYNSLVFNLGRTLCCRSPFKLW